MCGNDTFAMELSSTSMNVANVTVIATIHGFTRGRHAAGGAATGCETSGTSDTSAKVAVAIDSYLDTVGCGADSLNLPPPVTKELHPLKVLRLILAPHAPIRAVRHANGYT
jgi:hypothetical protein